MSCHTKLVASLLSSGILAISFCSISYGLIVVSIWNTRAYDIDDEASVSGASYLASPSSLVSSVYGSSSSTSSSIPTLGSVTTVTSSRICMEDPKLARVDLECVITRGRLPGGGGTSAVGKWETQLYEPEERLHSSSGGVKARGFCSASRNANE
ncbi:hypothetical protein NE237_024532 [Protea cynaroides]|uniref:Uncharacterized protein n=1 Tax=Protea cynaroides TaxID=273540 RepID=A0A9Q0JZA1_9MAGN|nr:hypothetical protein NE237_024532 [Protea cynaroides]